MEGTQTGEENRTTRGNEKQSHTVCVIVVQLSALAIRA